MMKNPKTLTEIRGDKRVDQIWHENEGFDNNSSWWCYLKPGWQAYNNKQHTIHEATLKEISMELKNVVEWLDDPELEH